ncbi:L-threonylcarbamoyladenylate synthase, partial [Paenibacillus maysiensis]|uniref:L-threonylcarbamoyladenylate synthase n=1 Tax=Paenibacillus maysiensis TaxID=1155954 RepID=UPI0004725F42
MSDKSNQIQGLCGESVQKEKCESVLDEQGLHELKPPLAASHTNWWDVRGLVVKGDFSSEMLSGQALIAAEKGIREAAVLLQTGGTVAFPTETVYGLGADARSTEAVESVFAAKGRPSDNPLIVHISDPAQLDGMVTEVNDTARALMDAFWPGPLTLVLPVMPQALSPCV